MHRIPTDEPASFYFLILLMQTESQASCMGQLRDLALPGRETSKLWELCARCRALFADAMIMMFWSCCMRLPRPETSLGVNYSFLGLLSKQHNFWYQWFLWKQNDILHQNAQLDKIAPFLLFSLRSCWHMPPRPPAGCACPPEHIMHLKQSSTIWSSDQFLMKTSKLKGTNQDKQEQKTLTTRVRSPVIVCPPGL